MNRRDFLGSSGAAVISAFFLSSCRSAVPVTTYSPSGRAFVFLESQSGVSIARIVDLSSMKFRDVEVPLVNAHSAQRVLSGADEFIAFDFMGRAVKANITTGKVTLAPAENSVFMGHATQSNDGTIIWCTEVKKKEEILVQARRSSDLSVISDPLHSFPGGHHIVKLPGSEFLATAWYNMEEGYPSVLFFDRQTGKKTVVRLPDHITVSHLLPVSSTEVVAITHVLSEKKNVLDPLNNNPIIRTAYDSMLKTNTSGSATKNRLEFDPAKPAPLVYASLSGQASPFWPEDHANLFRYGFSIDAVPGPGGRFISTHTLGNTVVIWNADRTVHRYISVTAPMGAISTPDGESILILSLGKIKVWSHRKEAFTDEIAYERPVASLSRYS